MAAVRWVFVDDSCNSAFADILQVRRYCVYKWILDPPLLAAREIYTLPEIVSLVSVALRTHERLGEFHAP